MSLILSGFKEMYRKIFTYLFSDLDFSQLKRQGLNLVNSFNCIQYVHFLLKKKEQEF